MEVPQCPKTVFIEGKAFNRVDIPATGQFQLLEIRRMGLYVLVHPDGRQAWFTAQDMNATVRRLGSKFRYTNAPMNDLKRLAKAGLRPFHVDPDFNVADFQ